MFFCSALGVAEYAQALYAMAMGSPELNGMTLFADPRLVANGFEIKLNPGKEIYEDGYYELCSTARGYLMLVIHFY